MRADDLERARVQRTAEVRPYSLFAGSTSSVRPGSIPETSRADTGAGHEWRRSIAGPSGPLQLPPLI
jgi:hypothetical protein